MEKWKIGTIVGLLACLGLYGVIQANGGDPEILPRPAMPTPPPLPVKSLMGTQVSDWSIPAAQWTNTPRPITLKDVKGKVTLMEFWRTGCSHCRETIPDMIAMYKKYTPQGLKVVTFQSPDAVTDEEDNWSLVKDFIKENKILYPVAFDAGGKLFLNFYKGTNFPTVIVLDRNGVARFIQTGHDEEKQQALESFIQSELKKK